MRLIYQVLSILFLFSYSQNVDAQMSINLDSVDGQNLNGAQLIIDTVPTNNISLPYIFVTNNTGSSQNWLITRRNILQPADWVNYLCWGDLCYSAYPLDIWSTNSATLTNGEDRKLTLYVNAPTVGVAHYRYYVSTDGVNFEDSVDVLMNVTSTAGISELHTNDNILFPNPAQNMVTISGFKNTSYSLKAYDNSGREVIDLKNATQNKIDVSNLNNGNYIFIIQNNSTQIKFSQQIVIKK